MNIIEWRNNITESELSYKAKLVGLVLSQFFRDKKPTYPSITTLSQLTSLTINPVQHGLNELQKNGFIIREKKRIKGNKFTSNVYTFIGVTNLHLSPHDTSNDTSNDTSYDTSYDISYDTSYDISPHDMEIDKEDKEDKEDKVKENAKNGSKLLLPDWLPINEWNAYLEMRIKKKKPATNKAKQLVIIKIDELRKKGNCPIKLLQQSVINNWTSVFETKETKKSSNVSLPSWQDEQKRKEALYGVN